MLAVVQSATDVLKNPDPLTIISGITDHFHKNAKPYLIARDNVEFGIGQLQTSHICCESEETNRYEFIRVNVNKKKKKKKKKHIIKIE